MGEKTDSRRVAVLAVELSRTVHSHREDFFMLFSSVFMASNVQALFLFKIPYIL